MEGVVGKLEQGHLKKRKKKETGRKSGIGGKLKRGNPKNGKLLWRDLGKSTSAYRKPHLMIGQQLMNRGYYAEKGEGGGKGGDIAGKDK